MNNWKDISLNFTPELQQEWESKHFSYSQVKEWIDIGLTPQDANFCDWLSEEGYTILEVLDYGDMENLRKDYEEYLLNPQPKPTRFNNKKPNWKLIISLILLALIILLFTS